MEEKERERKREKGRKRETAKKMERIGEVICDSKNEIKLNYVLILIDNNNITALKMILLMCVPDVMVTVLDF